MLHNSQLKNSQNILESLDIYTVSVGISIEIPCKNPGLFTLFYIPPPERYSDISEIQQRKTFQGNPGKIDEQEGKYFRFNSLNTICFFISARFGQFIHVVPVDVWDFLESFQYGKYNYFPFILVNLPHVFSLFETYFVILYFVN